MAVSNPFRSESGVGHGGGLTECRLCARLVTWREGQKDSVPKRFLGAVAAHGFWGRPVPAFGDPRGWLAIVGLAPAAHGANRTGRMFTGDRSGDFLYAALHRAGLSSQPASSHRGDGLALAGVLITAALRCAPPGNKPSSEELAVCNAYLRADLAGMSALRVVLALGGIAHQATLRALPPATRATMGEARFGHGRELHVPGGCWLVDSYHVSQQNTFTGRLTAAMFDTIVSRCLELASGEVIDG
jgi:uracil-DNA glycosylase family 4